MKFKTSHEFNGNDEAYETFVIDSIAEKIAEKIFLEIEEELSHNPIYQQQLPRILRIYNSIVSQTFSMEGEEDEYTIEELDEEQKQRLQREAFQILDNKVKKHLNSNKIEIPKPLTKDEQDLKDLDAYCAEYLKGLAREIKARVEEADRGLIKKGLILGNAGQLYQSIFKPKVIEITLEDDINDIKQMIQHNVLRRFKGHLSRNEYRQLKTLQHKFEVVAELREITQSKKISSKRLKKFERHFLDNFYVLKKNEDKLDSNFIIKVCKTLFSGFKLWNNPGDRFARNVSTLFSQRNNKQKKQILPNEEANPNHLHRKER